MAFFGADEGMFTIWGEAAGKPCSLLDAYEQNSLSTGATAEREFYIHTAVLNAHVHSLDELALSEVWLEIDGLFEFLWHEGRGHENLDVDGDDHLKVVDVPGATLTFHLSWDERRSTHRTIRERRARLRVQLAESAPYSTWFDNWVWALLNLVVFATREPSRLRSFKTVLYDREPAFWLQGQARERSRRRDVEFVSRESDLALTKPRFRYRRMLFGLGELGDDASRFLSRWLEMHNQLARGRNVFFSALTSVLYQENLLLNLMSAAEAYHRTFHDEPPLRDERHEELMAAMLQIPRNEERDVYTSPLEYANQQRQAQRLRWLYDRAATVIPELAPMRKDFVRQLVETRNFFTHLGERSVAVRDGWDLALLLDRLVLVLQSNFLIDLGLETQDVERALRRSYAEGQERVLRGEDTSTAR